MPAASPHNGSTTIMTKAHLRWIPWLVLVTLSQVCGQTDSLPGPAERTVSAATKAAPHRPLKVVLWVGGFAHEFKKVVAILSEALPSQLPMQMSVAWNGDFLDAPDQPDVILMYHCHKAAKGVLTSAQQDKLLAMVKAGVGVVAVHSSYYSFLKWDAYHDFHGARFIKHGKSEAKLQITLTKKQHPIFAGLDTPIELVSELYQSTPVPKDCQILGHSREGNGKPQPSIWTRDYGKGRVVTILPGHWPQNYRHPPFQRLILNSLTWVTKEREDTSSKIAVWDSEWEKAAVSHLKLPEGFEVSLVAAEPHLANPISMTLDEAGHIYVSNAHSYRQKWWLMNPAPAMEPTNPVVRLTPGPDGRANEATVVADGFKNPVMGLAIRDARLWATNLNRLFVTDLDERGRMIGERKVLVRDAATPWNPFGMYRTTFGPDGLLYLSVGDHATQLTGTTGTSAVRQDHKGSGAVFRFREDGSDLELMLEGMRAPFTLGFTPYGRLWVITNGEGSPNCLLDAIHGCDYRFRNQGKNNWAWLVGAEPLAAPAWETAPGAHTAVLPYYSSSLPEEYWGNLFVSNFGVHGAPAKRNEVLRLVTDDRGRIVRREVFISSSDPMFRPTQLSLAPDGSLYLLDWYGKDDENDLTGRLYRIRYTGKQALRAPASGLGSSNHVKRRVTKAALLAAGPASLPELDRALSGTDSLAAAEATWTLRRSGWELAAGHVRIALSHRDWRVRRLAVQVLREMKKQKPEDLRGLLSDPDPAVRLEAALGFDDPRTRCTALVEALRSGTAKIRRLRFVAALEVAHHGEQEHFNALLADANADVRLAGLIALDEAFYESSMGFQPHSTGRTDELTAANPAAPGDPALRARSVLAQLIAAPGRLDVADLLDLARRWPHADLKQAVGKIVNDRLCVTGVSASDFAQGVETLKRMELPTRNAHLDLARNRILTTASPIMDAGIVTEKLGLLCVMEAGDARATDLSILKRLMADRDPAVRTKAYTLLAKRHVNADAAELCSALALDQGVGLDQRLDALPWMAELEKTPNRANWTELLRSSQLDLALASLRSLQRCGDRSTARDLLEHAAGDLRKRHGAAVEDDLAFVAAALDGKALASVDKATLRQEVLARSSTGSPERGRLVFRTRACSTCHTTDNAVALAPPLEHIAASHDTAYLLDSVLYPDKAVKTGFLTQMITVQKGRRTVVITGTLRPNVSGEGRWAEVTDNAGHRKLYRSSRIKSVKAISVMPPGLETTMSQAELIDLIAYLGSLK